MLPESKNRSKYAIRFQGRPLTPVDIFVGFTCFLNHNTIKDSQWYAVQRSPGAAHSPKSGLKMTQGCGL